MQEENNRKISGKNIIVIVKTIPAVLQVKQNIVRARNKNTGTSDARILDKICIFCAKQSGFNIFSPVLFFTYGKR